MPTAGTWRRRGRVRTSFVSMLHFHSHDIEMSTIPNERFLRRQTTLLRITIRRRGCRLFIFWCFPNGRKAANESKTEKPKEERNERKKSIIPYFLQQLEFMMAPRCKNTSTASVVAITFRVRVWANGRNGSHNCWRHQSDFRRRWNGSNYEQSKDALSTKTNPQH